jgi:hypothetical protein
MQLSELWFMTNTFITGAPLRLSIAEEVDSEHVTVWPLLILEPDTLTRAAGFTKKVLRLQHFIVGNF